MFLEQMNEKFSFLLPIFLKKEILNPLSSFHGSAEFTVWILYLSDSIV